MVVSKEGGLFAEGILTEAKVPFDNVYGFDVMTILTILSVVIQIIKFLYPYFTNVDKLPLWKKVLIRWSLVSKFGFAKARQVEEIMYRRIKSLTKEQADTLVNIVV